MTKPDFMAQVASVDLNSAALYPVSDWLKARAAEMRAKGATHCRATKDEGPAALILLEGWRVRPKVEPPPDFAMERTT